MLSVVVIGPQVTKFILTLYLAGHILSPGVPFDDVKACAKAAVASVAIDISLRATCTNNTSLN